MRSKSTSRLAVGLLTLIWFAAASRAGFASTHAGGDELWESVFAGGKGFNVPNSIGVSPDGSTIYITGSTGQGSGLDVATAALDTSTGAVLWSARYDGGVLGPDAGVDLAVAPDGSRIYVGATSSAGTTNDWVVLSYDSANGHQHWRARYNGRDGGEDEVGAIAASADGSSVFVTGMTTAGGHFDFGTVALDATTGHRSWAAVVPSAGNQRNEPADIAVSPDSQTVYVTGKDYEPTTGYDYTTVAYSASLGQREWGRRYDRSGLNGMDSATSLGVSPDGSRVVVTGMSDSNLTTVAYDANTGHAQWTAETAAALFAPPPRLVIAPDGGATYVAYTTGDVSTVAYDMADGTPLWDAVYDGPAHAWDEGHAVAVSPDGSHVYVTGMATAPAPAAGEYVTLAYDSEGGSVWTSLWDGPASVAYAAA